jgi:hypothetical protein
VAEVTGYKVLDFGTSNGFQDSRAEIQLMNGSNVLGWVRFHDPGMPSPNDTISSTGRITMNLPLAMFDNVLDVLRNEKPVHFRFNLGRALLETSHEPVGENECGVIPADLPNTRAPIFVEWRSFNHFTDWKHIPEIFKQELQAYPPVVVWSEGGFGGHVENLFNWGVVKGVVTPAEPDAELYGNGVTPAIQQIFDAGLPDPETIANRFTELQAYLAAYEEAVEGITKPTPYADLGTEIFGKRIPPTRTGFWGFYDRWDSYALPTPDRPEAHGPFDLGPRPPDPSEWLRKWHDPENSSVCPSPDHVNCAPLSQIEKDNLKGNSFVYGPQKPEYGPYFRFSVCLNTEGWKLWWKQVFQWLARVGFKVAFVDNSNFTRCWNKECQDGYRAWLAQHYSTGEIERFFKVSTSLLPDHSFEHNWFRSQSEDGPWMTNYAFAESGAIFPDNDSYGGRHSARLEGPGVLRLERYPFEAPSQEEKDYRLTIHYKTDGDVGARLRVRQRDNNFEFVNESLAPLADWAEFTTDPFHVTTGVQFIVDFALERTGRLWVDELWLSHVVVNDGEETLEHPTFETGLWFQTFNRFSTQYSERLRDWAASAYWDSVVDEKLVYLREMAREVYPDFQLFTNSYRQRQGSDYFMVEFQTFGFEQKRQDTGHTPGVYRPAPPGAKPQTLRGRDVESEVLNTNIFDYKYSYSRRRLDSFAYHIHSQAESVSLYLPANPVTGEPAIYQYKHNVDSALLAHAETAAFGAGAGVDLMLRRYGHAYEPDEKQKLRERSKEFFQFVSAHRDAYECLRSYGEVGLIFHGIRPHDDYHNEIFDLANGLAGHGVLWDLLTEERCTAANFARYKVLTCHAVEQMAEPVARALLGFIESGGLVIASGSEAGSVDPQGAFTRFYVGMLDELFRTRAASPDTRWPPVRLSGSTMETHGIGLGRLISVPAGPLDIEQFIRLIEDFFAEKGRPRRLGVVANLTSPALERLRVAAWADADRLALHLVNYNVPLGKENSNQVAALLNLEVEMMLPQDWAPSSVRLLTPEETGATGEVPFAVTEGVINFVIPTLHIYEIALMQ